MKCTTALKINNREQDKKVSQYGAKLITKNSNSVVNRRDLSVKTSMPTPSELNNSTAFDKGASYIFSNINPVNVDGLDKLGVTEDEDAMDRLSSVGANLYKDIANNYFKAKNNKIISPTPNNATQIIFEGSAGKVGNNRTFISISNSDIAEAKSIVDLSMDNDADNSEDKVKLFNEGMEFLLISALYRGYDISIKSPIDASIVKSAINKYNKGLKDTSKKVVYSSSYRSDDGILKADSVKDVENKYIPKDENKSKNIDDNSMLLNATLSNRDRETLALHKEPDMISKLVIANRVIAVFKDMVPNLDTKILSTSEIRMIYGSQFADKKGFVIGGSIILNQDKFNSSTLFHEFGHYYSRWLSTYRSDAYTTLMEVVKNEYSSDIPGYSSLYESTGITHSSTDILEEVFVDKLGILAASQLERSLSGIDINDSTKIAETVDEFALSFIRKLTKNSTIDTLGTGFTTKSTIGDIFNIGMRHSSSLNPTSLAVFDTINMNSLKDFFIDKASARDVYSGLIQRGFIKSLGNNFILLYDSEGNRVDNEGNINSTAKYKMSQWDTVKNIKANYKVLDSMSKYLDQNKNYAEVRFAVHQTPTDIVEQIKRAKNGLELTDDSVYYIKDGVKADRVTHYLQDNFSSKAQAEMFIANKIYGDYFRDFKKKEIIDGALDDTDLSDRAYEATHKFMTLKGPDYRDAYKKVSNLFAFKTEEGTYLHSIAEFYFRALNYSQNIRYPASVENRSIMYFSKHIAEGIAADTTEDFTEYFEKNFFNHLKGQEDTDDYKAFLEGFNSLKETMANRSVSKAPAAKFIELLRDIVVPDLNKLKGPLTILPEVRLMSKSMGVAGTIDLLVVDGDGKAHIYDYKTKETNKRHLWNWNEGTNMKGVMGAYKENAMMKASIQTSIYKLMLKEMGIDTGHTAVYYVESSLPPNATADAFADLNSIRYQPKAIKKEGLIDVSAELLEHFTLNNRKPTIVRDIDPAKEINVSIIAASGGVDIDATSDIDKTARAIYNRAVKSDVGSTEDRKIAFLMANFSGVKDANGKAKGLVVTLPGFIKRELDSNLETEEEKVAAIADLLRNKETVRTMESTLSQIYYAQDRTSTIPSSVSKSRDMNTALRALVRGADASSHDLIKMSSNADYGIDNSGVMLLKNKITGDVRMIIINQEDSENIYFGEGTDRNNIFGKYLTNNGMRIASPTFELKNTTHNMRLLKAGMMMIHQKMSNPDFNVSLVISNPGIKEESNNVPKLHDVSSILNSTKILMKLMVEAGDPIPTFMKEALLKPELFESKNYLKNPVEALTEYLSITAGDLLRNEDIFTTNGERKNKAQLKLLLDTYDPNHDSHKLIDALHDYRNALSRNLKDTSQKVNSDIFTLTDAVLMYLKGFNYSINPKDSSVISNFGMTASKMSNKYAASFNRKIQESATDIRTDFMEYKNEHNKLLVALAKAKGVSLDVMSQATYKDSMKMIFKDLYTTDNKTRATAFILKDPSQVSTQAEKDYLIYLKKSFQKFGEMSTYSKVEVPYGWMPLTSKSRMSASSDKNILDKAREVVQLYNFNSAMHDDPGRKPIDDDFSCTSPYAGQLPGSDSSPETQYTFDRRKMLSIKLSGEDSGSANERPLSNIEDNLENVLDAYVIAALDTYHYKDVTEFGRALFYQVRRYEDLSQRPLTHLVDAISIIQKRVINHEESDKQNKIIGGIDKFATNAAIAGTVTQALLETFTNPLVTSANYFGDLIYGTLFKGVREFSFASYSEAFKLVALTYGKEKDIIEAISNTYGIVNSDTAALKDMMNQLENNSIFQSKNLMYVNKIMLESWQKITMVAYMLEQGSFWAHSIDENGNLVYDETKDKRFHFANKGASDDVIKDKKKFYEATKLEMAKQRNGLTESASNKFEDRKLKKAWTTFDANYVKEMIVEAYSSLDDSSKSLIMYYSLASLFRKMKTWIFSKTSRYFQKPMTAEENESASRLVKVPDPNNPGDYKYEWKGSDTEGIVFTMAAVTRQLYEYNTDFLQKQSLTDNQKKNLSKLIGDIGIFSIMSFGAAGIFKYALDDEQREDELVKLVYTRWQMATSDVLVLKSIGDLLTGTGSLAVGLSIAKRAAVSVINTAVIAPQVLIYDDVTLEDLQSAANHMGSSLYGPYKTLVLAKDVISNE